MRAHGSFVHMHNPSWIKWSFAIFDQIANKKRAAMIAKHEAAKKSLAEFKIPVRVR